MGPLLTRLVSGDGIRKTRLHNYRGEMIDWAGLQSLPTCLCSTIRFKLTGRRPDVPWLGYRAVRRLSALIQPDWSILEFGSGSSSIWFAKRCRQLLSIETDPAWFTATSRRFEMHGICNVDYRLLPLATCEQLPDVPAHSVAFALVDGVRRGATMHTAVEKVRPGGWIYLDNSDCLDDDYREAESILLAASVSPPQYFTDFCPLLVAVTEGMLACI